MITKYSKPNFSTPGPKSLKSQTISVASFNKLLSFPTMVKILNVATKHSCGNNITSNKLFKLLKRSLKVTQTSRNSITRKFLAIVQKIN